MNHINQSVIENQHTGASQDLSVAQNLVFPPEDTKNISAHYTIHHQKASGVNKVELMLLCIQSCLLQKMM